MPAALPPGHAESDSPLLVGREREQRHLRGHLTSAAAGRGRLVLVEGSAGLGKTALVTAMAREAGALGFLVLGGACYDLTATPPYGPWRDLAAGYRPVDGLPPLPAMLTADEPADASGPGMLFTQMREFLATLAAVRPALLVLEDLHWADPASLDLLRVVGRHLADGPLLVVGTYRADEVTHDNALSRIVHALVREAQADRLDLQRLDLAGIRALVTARYALPEADTARLAAYLQTNADGNPFFAHEILRTLEAGGVLQHRDQGWVLGESGRAGVPPLLRQVIDDRVARLGDEVRERLAVAAVIGQEAPLDLWAAIGELAEESLLPTVERAIAAHLLEARDDGTSVRFAHALVREALYEGILPMRRRAWHRRVGEALADRPGADPDAVAHHFVQAGDERAATWLVRAGERAQRAYAWRNAADRFTVAAAALEGDATRARERGWLLYRIGRLLRAADPSQGITYLEEAWRVAAAIEDPVLAAYALADQGMLRCFVRDIRRGLAEMVAGTDALDALTVEPVYAGGDIASWVADALPEPTHARAPAGNPRPASRVNPRRGALVHWLAAAGRFDEVEQMGLAQLSEAEHVVRPDEAVLSSIGDIHFGLGVVAAVRGRPDAAIAAFAQARVAHRAIDHYFGLAEDAKQELHLVYIPYRTTRLAERRRLRAEVETVLSRPGEGRLLSLLVGTLLHSLLVDGAWTEPQVALDQDSVHNIPSVYMQCIIGDVGWFARHQGQPDLAWSLVREDLPDGPQTEPGGSMFQPTLGLIRVAAELALDVSNLPAARDWLMAHDRWLAWGGTVLGQAEGHVLWARYHLVAGDVGAARQRADRAVQRSTEPRQPLALLRAHRLSGEIETVAGRTAQAAAALAKSLALADACAAPFERALTLLALAELRTVTGQTIDARTAIDEVRAICGPLNAVLALTRADAVLARLSAATMAGNHPARLSLREIEVLRLLVAGHSNPEIADALFISRRTVTTHITNLYAKLGVDNRVAAVHEAHRRGLLDLGPT